MAESELYDKYSAAHAFAPVALMLVCLAASPFLLGLCCEGAASRNGRFLLLGCFWFANTVHIADELLENFTTFSFESAASVVMSGGEPFVDSSPVIGQCADVAWGLAGSTVVLISLELAQLKGGVDFAEGRRWWRVALFTVGLATIFTALALPPYLLKDTERADRVFAEALRYNSYVASPVLVFVCTAWLWG